MFAIDTPVCSISQDLHFILTRKKGMDVIKTLGASHIAGRLCISREWISRNAVSRPKRGFLPETRFLAL